MSDHLTWYDELREAGRVHWHEQTHSWYVPRFDDVWDLLVDNRLGARTTSGFTDRMTPEQRELCEPVLDFISRWPVFSEMPRHTSLHRTILPCFTAGESERIAGAVRSYLDTAEVNWRGDDLIDDVLRPACTAGLAAFLGVPAAELARVPAWSARLIAFAGQTAYDHEIMTRASVALREFGEFVDRACAGGYSVLSTAMRRAREEGTLDRSDVVAVYGQMVTGFLQPTVSALTMAVETVLADPARLDAFRSDPDTFISESIRLASPFHFAPRRTLAEIQVGDQLIPADQRVVLLLVSANRDPRRFPEPLRFRMDRGTPPHVAFARGRYACVGAGTARQIIRGVLSAVVERLAGTEPRVDWQIGRGMRMPMRLSVVTA